MKGDGNIKIIKFIGTGYNNHYQAHIKILNKNILVYEGITYNGEINICLEEGIIYKIEVYFIKKEIYYLYISKNKKYTFVLDNALYKTITISLVDFYYNLPIEKGEMILWQRQ